MAKEKDSAKTSDNGMSWNGSAWVRYDPEVQKAQAVKDKKLAEDRQKIADLQKEVDALSAPAESEDQKKILALEKQLADLKAKIG